MYYCFLCNVKVLILHQHFKTPEKGGALRSYFLAKALVDSGIETIVITTHNQPAYIKKNIEGVDVHFLPIAYDNSFGFYKRIRSFLQFIVQSCRLALTIRSLDTCYAISTPLTVGLAAILIKWRRKTPFIFEVGDLWPDAPIQLGFVKNSFLKFLLFCIEYFIYKQSQSIVALSTTMKGIIEKKVPGKQVHLIPNMADTNFFVPETKRKDLELKFGVADRFVVSYIGSVGYANGLVSYLDCARVAKQAGMAVSFLLCGEGGMLTYLKETAKKFSIDNLIFVDFQNRQGIKEVMNVTDAVFISYRHHAILETGSPNKYFDGLAAGKLIITNFGGWIKEEIEKHACGFYVDADQPNQFVTSLNYYLRDAQKLNSAKENARELAKKYDHEKLSAEFVEILNKL
jgi:glycosyltransferase involved in cell wall biosynthesis